MNAVCGLVWRNAKGILKGLVFKIVFGQGCKAVEVFIIGWELWGFSEFLNWDNSYWFLVCALSISISVYGSLLI